MNKLSEKIKIYFRKRKNRISITGISISVDWIFITIFTLAVLFGVFVYGFFLYNGISSGSIFEIVEVDNRTDFDQKKKDIANTIKLLDSSGL